MENMIGLGRRYSPDPRDFNHLITAAAPKAVTAKTWSSPGVLDQGATSQCVAYSTAKYLSSAPVKNVWPGKISDLYLAAQDADEWPGNDYDGTSVHGVMKVLKNNGYISEYKWAFTLEPVVAHLLTVGPVVVGTNWYEEMFMTDRWGYIDPKGAEAGGHAWLLIGANTKRKNPDGSVGAVRMINSWGDGWGQKGRAWVSFKTMERLIKEDGEACVATEIKHK